MFEELTDDLSDINLPLIADEVTAAVRDNPELLAAFLEETLRPMVYEVGFSVLQSQRARSHRLTSTIKAVSAVVTPASSTARSIRGQLLRPPARRSGFDWLRQPVMVARGRQIRMASARKHDFDLAIDETRRRVEPGRHRVAYYTLVRDALPDPDQTVEDVLDSTALSRLWDEAGGRVRRENEIAADVEKRLAARKASKALPTP